MADPVLIVPVVEIARRLGVVGDPTAQQTQTITDALVDVQADVQAYLGVPLVPTVKDVTLNPWDDVAEVLAYYPKISGYELLPQVDGTTTLRITYGYNAATDPELEPIRRYIRYAVLMQPTIITLWRAIVGDAATRLIRSASVEGQSVTYDRLTPTGEIFSTRSQSGGNLPVTAPSLKSLDTWRVAGRRVSQGVGYQSDPMPHDAVYWGGGGWWPH